MYWREIQNLATPSCRRLPLVKHLHLFLDREGFLRCGGRIHNAPLSHDKKFPHLLSPRHPSTTLIVYLTHIQLYHAGVSTTATTPHQPFWILTARQHVKTLLRHCNKCRRQCGKPYPLPDPAPLPKNRAQNLSTFTVTGIDFTGVLYVHDNNQEAKVCVCLFTPEQ